MNLKKYLLIRKLEHLPKHPRPPSPIRFIIAIIIFIIFIILLSVRLCSMDYLVSDYDFTNQSFTDRQCFNLIKACPKSKLSHKQTLKIIKECRKYKINFLLVSAKLQQEASLILNNSSFDYKLRERRAMGYGCYIKRTNSKGVVYRPYEGYYQQIERGVRALRIFFDRWKPGKCVLVLSKEKRICPKNAATYSLYVYTPFYGNAIAFGHKTVGNRRFMASWYIVKDIWKRKKY